MPRKKTRQKKTARKACNNIPKQQSRVSDYLAHRSRIQQSNAPNEETNPTLQQDQQPKETTPRQKVPQTSQTTAITQESESEEQPMQLEQPAADNEVQFIGSQKPLPKTGRQESEEEEDEEESTSEEQPEEEEESDEDGRKMETDEEEEDNNLQISNEETPDEEESEE
jgi:hypothetical protein